MCIKTKRYGKGKNTLRKTEKRRIVRAKPKDEYVREQRREKGAVLPYSKLNKMFFGYFDPGNIFLDNKNK